MQNLIQKIQQLSIQKIDDTLLKNFVNKINIDELNFEEQLPKPKNPFCYGRNILTLKPFECVLLNWPPNVESAIHHHQGLFGYVLVLKGEINNHFYEEGNGLLRETAIQSYFKGGIISEPDGIIHKIANNSKINNAVTLHFYYPPMENLEGLKIYNTSTNSIGILSDQANSANWSDEKGHFKSIEDNAFSFIPFVELNKNKSHVILPVFPKPNSLKIMEMNKSYYNEQAYIYDQLDQENPIRNAYTSSIDNKIANDLKKSEFPIHKVLDIATGTGRRPLKIRKLSGLDYEIQGVEASEEMVKKAKENGLDVIFAHWTDFNLEEKAPYDAITLLYGFGHIPDNQTRLKLLKHINKHLKIGGSFYFDVFNINNENEWGPTCIEQFHNLHQEKCGYQLGDVFYRRTDGDRLAYLHYFDKKEIIHLLEETGFEIKLIQTIGYINSPGEEMNSEKEGHYYIKGVKIND